MARTSKLATISRWADHYIEEVAVGTPLWVLVVAFGLGMPLLAWVGALIYHARYQPGTYPIALFVGATIGLGLRMIARERERYRASALNRSGDLQALRKLAWNEFEVVVGEALRRQGYTVKERGGFQADGGVDLVAERNNKLIAIQCKHWRTWMVSVPRVRELLGTVKGGNFSEGWLVTCGGFTSAARSWARGKELRLVDGNELASIIGGTVLPRKSPDIRHSQTEIGWSCPNCGAGLLRLTNSNDGSKFWGCEARKCGWTFNDPPTGSDVVLCDRGHPMVERITKLGVQFWGCSMYPKCQRKRLVAPRSPAEP
jgi:restriction system protein